MTQITKFGLGLYLFFITSCGFQSIPRAQNDVEAGWAEVMNQYKRRADLVPNLVNVVKGSAAHERETLEAVIEARAKATQTTIDASQLNAKNMQELERAQGQLGQALSRLMVVAERYPNLQANKNFRDLQVQLEGTENRITVARNRYIESVKQFNNLVTVPPESLTNSLYYKYEKKPQFSVANEEEVQKTPTVDFN